MHSASVLIHALDLIGTFVFAMSGATLGMRRGMDLFGVLVLAFVTAVFGGVTRDVLIGAVPPAAIGSPSSSSMRRGSGCSRWRVRRRPSTITSAGRWPWSWG
jgi:uncharacterized membrane protein YeiH